MASLPSTTAPSTSSTFTSSSTTNTSSSTSSSNPACENGQGGYQGKHSSGDLHSRLKTRKILGVGETDNGDIHRSKISQVLGHNEHLYVKLPRGFWSAHVAMGVGVTLEAGLLLLAPRLASRLGVMPFDDDDDDDDDIEDTTAARVAGAALAGLCVFVWSLLGTSDKHYARTMLLSMLTYHILSICVSAAAALTTTETVMTTMDGQEVPTSPGEGAAGAEEGGGGGGDDGGLFGSRLALCVSVRALMCLVCLAYFYSIAGYAPIRGQKPTGFRQPTHGHKDQ